MSKKNTAFHGSDLELIADKYNLDKEEITSYSGNINPLGISSRVTEELARNIDLISEYPDRQYTSLRKKISEYTDASIEHITVGSAVTGLLSLLIEIIAPEQALLIQPAYSEYEREVELNGGSVAYHRLEEDADFELDVKKLKADLNSTIDLLIICNPNNPTSTTIERSKLAKIMEHCQQNDIFVLIDETYVEFAEQRDDITGVPLVSDYSNLAILRGVSKFFSAPGLRFGYTISSNQEILRAINSKRKPWDVNTLTAYAGELMLTDKEYINRSIKLISEERQKIYQTLSSWDKVKVFRPGANFVLFKILDDQLSSNEITEKLIVDHQILIRNAVTFEYLNDKFLRFCFLSPEENSKLLKVLKEVLDKS